MLPSEGWAEQQDSLLLLLGACQAENVLSLDEKCLISGISRWNGEPWSWLLPLGSTSRGYREVTRESEHPLSVEWVRASGM